MYVRFTLQGAVDETLEALSGSICSHLGQLAELRMDENDLACDASALAPLCKLRNVRTLSIEKNRLTRVPPLIGTMLTIRHLLLYSNQVRAAHARLHVRLRCTCARVPLRCTGACTPVCTRAHGRPRALLH